MSAASTQRSAILELLRETREDGATVNSMVEAGGMWWKERVTEINGRSGYNIGWELVEGEKRYFLVVEPDVEGDRGGDSDALLLPGPSERSSPTIVLDVRQPSLFPSGFSHYREAA